HGFVHGIAQHRQHAGQHRQREFPLEEGEEAQDDDHVVQVGNDPGHREFPFEAKAQVHHDADHDEQQRHQAVVQQFLAHLRAHELDAAQFGRRIDRLERAHDGFALRGRRLPFGNGQPYHDIARGAEVLHLEIRVSQPGYGAAHAVELYGLRVAYFHDRAAGELDGQVKAARDDEEHRRHERDQADQVQHQGMAHERYGAVNAEKFHVLPCFLSAGRAGRPARDQFVLGFQTVPMEILASFFLRPYHRLARARTPTTDVNIDVAIPRQCTTAKPRTGPEPKASRASPTMSVVRFESRMVPQARSKPWWMACCGVAPLRSSSRMRSLMSTFESMAMPRVSAMAAMPGSVSVACSMDSRASSSSTFIVRPMVENTPNRWQYRMMKTA